MTQTMTAFDLETTGLDTQKDYIIELGLVKFDTSTFKELDSRCWYILPKGNFEIEPEAQEKHGISKEYLLEHGVRLEDIWSEVVEFIGDDDILSYNGNHFDVPMLYYNLIRENLKFDFSGRIYYDSMIVEKKRLQYKLVDTYKRYTGKELDGAHDALCDVRATIEVFKHQLNEVQELFDLYDFKLVSPEGFVKYNDKGELVFANGKYKGKRTNDICKTDVSYIKWVFEKFSPETRISIRDEYYKENPKQ